MLIVTEPPELGLSAAVLRENGQRQEWCKVCLLHTELDYSKPDIVLEPRSIVWAHHGRYLSPASLRHLVTGMPREYHGSHDGLEFAPPRDFFVSQTE